MIIKDKVAIITGGASGFGSALARRIVTLGGKVVVADVSVKGAKDVADELNAQVPGSAIAVKCNVVLPQEQKAMFMAALDAFGRIDIVVNNAGIAEKGPFLQDEADAWQAVIAIDLTAVIMGTRMAIAHFQKQHQPGVIINTASLAGLYPQPKQPVYAAAKGGVVMFTKSLANLASENIRVNAICPSFSRTGILKDAESFGLVFDDASLVPVQVVIDAFIIAIENESLAGDCLRILPSKGIELLGKIRTETSKL